jgi:hypothetical protein
VLQVLVDADNVPAGRIQALLLALAAYQGGDHSEDEADDMELVVAGHADAIGALSWPATATVVEAEGWQRADIALAAAYRSVAGPLVIASGDADFALLAARHPGPVLVISEAAAGRFREIATVIDPVHDGAQAISRWLAATAGSGSS